MNKLIVSLSPHVHGGDSVKKNMYGVLIALIPAFLVSLYFFGLGALILPESSSSPLFEGGFFPTLHPAKAKNRARTFYFRIVINFAVLPKIRNKNHRHSRYFKKKR